MIHRTANPTDDFSTVLTPEVAAVPWNRDNVFVAEEDGQIVGLIIFWDAGHPVIMVEYLTVHKDKRQSGVGQAMVRAFEDFARQRGAKGLVGYGTDPNYLAMVQHCGGEVRDVMASYIVKKL